MDFEAKVISREVSELLWDMEKTVGTAESCTGGRIAEAIMSVPGASKYFKGGVISYVNEIKESLLGVDPQVLEEQTAVCEEVAKEMVLGACKILNTNYAISATGVVGEILILYDFISFGFIFYKILKAVWNVASK